MLPAASVPRTANVCSALTSRSSYGQGLEQGSKSLPSIEQPKRTFGSFARKLKVASRSRVRAGGVLTIVVTGGSRSTEPTIDQLYFASGPNFSFGALARTAKLCLPRLRYW